MWPTDAPFGVGRGELRTRRWLTYGRLQVTCKLPSPVSDKNKQGRTLQRDEGLMLVFAGSSLSTQLCQEIGTDPLRDVVSAGQEKLHRHAIMT